MNNTERKAISNMLKSLICILCEYNRIRKTWNSYVDLHRLSRNRKKRNHTNNTTFNSRTVSTHSSGLENMHGNYQLIQYHADKPCVTCSVNRGCKSISPRRLRKIYLKLACLSHPDKGGDESLFKTITESYEQGDLMKLLIHCCILGDSSHFLKDDKLLVSTEIASITQLIFEFKMTDEWKWGETQKTSQLSVN